jgi:pimeloyl-ACP methyl ester carboxylesterase
MAALLAVLVGKKHGYDVPINGLKMYYEINAAGVAPLVLLHDGGSTVDTTFGKILPSLARIQQIIAVEQHGHGRTADMADWPRGL